MQVANYQVAILPKSTKNRSMSRKILTAFQMTSFIKQFRYALVRTPVYLIV